MSKTISPVEARELTIAAIAKLEDEIQVALTIIDEHTETVEAGYVFFYNSAAFAQSRDFRDSLAGNGPIFVDHHGKTTHLGTAFPWRESLLQIQQ